MELIVYPDRDMMMIDVAARLADDLSDTLSAHDAASLAVPGGSTPGPVFDSLSAADLDWDRVTILLTDERWVPESSPRSNAALVRDRLMRDRASAATFLGYRDAEGPDTPEPALDDLRGRLAPHLPLSVLLLGMGADMHTASLFPGAEGLDAALAEDAAPILPIRAEAAGEPRVTLTRPVLEGAMSTHVLITGADKRAALERAEAARDLASAPVRVILGDAIVHWAE